MSELTIEQMKAALCKQYPACRLAGGKSGWVFIPVSVHTYDAFETEEDAIRDAYNRLVTPPREQKKEAEATHLRKVLGKPRCLDCNGARMTNCGYFDECGGTFKYALEYRAEQAEAERDRLLEAIKAATKLLEDGMPTKAELCLYAALPNTAEEPHDKV